MASSCPPRAPKWQAIANATAVAAARSLGAALLGLLLAGAASAEPPVAPFSHQYRLKAAGVPFSVAAQRTLKALPDGTWRMDVLARNFLGEIRETSVFAWRGCTPVTRSYSYRRKGFGQLKTAEVHIDGATGQATSQRSKHAPRRFPATGATDKIAMTLALQCRLARGESDLTLQVVDERKQETQRFEIEGRETLTIGDDTLETIRVRRVRDARDERQTWLWFAPRRHYLLVQLVQENNDGRHVLTLEPSP